MTKTPDDVAATLRATTAEMAAACSVPMELWDRHSNAALAACATIEALTAERDSLQARVETMAADLQFMTENRNKWQDATTVARRERDALRAALEPFGEAIQWVNPELDDDYSPDWALFFNYGDFRRADATLNPKKYKTASPDETVG